MWDEQMLEIDREEYDCAFNGCKAEPERWYRAVACCGTHYNVADDWIFDEALNTWIDRDFYPMTPTAKEIQAMIEDERWLEAKEG